MSLPAAVVGQITVPARGVLGRLEAAIALGEYAISRDPVNAANHANLGNSYRWSGQPEKAIAAYRTALQLSPGLGAANSFIGVALISQGKHEEALRAMQLEPFEPYRLIGLALAYHAMGDQDGSDTALAELIEKHAQEWAYNIAYVHAARAQRDLAFEWLERAVEYHDPGLAPEVSAAFTLRTEDGTITVDLPGTGTLAKTDNAVTGEWHGKDGTITVSTEDHSVPGTMVISPVGEISTKWGHRPCD